LAKGDLESFPKATEDDLLKKFPLIYEEIQKLYGGTLEAVMWYRVMYRLLRKTAEGYLTYCLIGALMRTNRDIKAKRDAGDMKWTPHFRETIPLLQDL
jgi:hypothetical protein